MPDSTYARLNNIVVVIRAAGERTVDACRAIVQDQIAEERIRVVRERPFEAALKRSYEIGISEGTKWLMTLDADVLLRENAIIEFYKQAEKMPNRFFQVEGLVHDKMTGLYRKAGHRLYRTKYLNTAYQQIPNTYQEIRPEHATLKKMDLLGFPSLEIDAVFGIHDYEQFYRDVYRKAFVHANKHQMWLPQFIKYWKERADNDRDYLVALRGLYDGLVSTNEVMLDNSFYSEKAKTAMVDLGLIEKPYLLVQDIDYQYVEGVIANHLIKEGNQSQKKFDSKIQRFKDKYRRLGAIRFGPHFVGSILCDLGNKIKIFSKPQD